MTWVRLSCAADGSDASSKPTIIVSGTRDHAWGTPVGGTGWSTTTGMRERAAATGTQAAWWVDDEPDGLALRVINDRWGFAPVFWWSDASSIIVADRVDDILDQLAHADEAQDVLTDAMAAATTLEIGQPVGEETLFTGVRALPPAATLCWRPARPVEITVQPDRPPVPTSASRDRRIDAFLEAFEVAISRRHPVDAPVIVPLSGGADSRHILLELVAQGVSIDGVVTAATHRADPELKAASIVASRLGVAHHVVDHPVGSLAAEQRNNRLTNYQASELAWYLPVIDHLRSEASTTYDGIGGDVLSAALYQSPLRVAAVRRDDWHGLVEDLTGTSRQRQRFVPTAVAGSLPPRDAVLDHLAETWRSHAGEPNPLAWAMFTTRTRRHIAMAPCALLHGLTVHTPYLDDDVVAALRPMPMTDPVDHQFHRDAIARRFPAFADVPYDDEISTTWHDARAAIRRRSAAFRLMVEAGDMFVGGMLSRMASLPSARFKSFKEVRRAIVVQQAAERASHVSGGSQAAVQSTEHGRRL